MVNRTPNWERSLKSSFGCLTLTAILPYMCIGGYLVSFCLDPVNSMRRGNDFHDNNAVVPEKYPDAYCAFGLPEIQENDFGYSVDEIWYDRINSLDLIYPYSFDEEKLSDLYLISKCDEHPIVRATAISLLKSNYR